MTQLSAEMELAEQKEEIRAPLNPNDPHELKPLRYYVQRSLHNYFSLLEGHPPGDLYQMVLQEVEQPLLEAVMHYTRGNQSKAASLLGINRGTLRKKLAQYGIE